MLARELTTLVHGADAMAAAVKASDILFGGSLEGVAEEVFRDVVGEAPTVALEKAKLDGSGLPLIDLLVHSALSSSRGQAKKDIEGGGIYLNNVRAGDLGRSATAADLLFGRYLLLRKGKRTYALVHVA